MGAFDLGEPNSSMKFTQIVPDRGTQMKLGQELSFDQRRQRTDARADAVSWIANKLNEFSFDTRVSEEMERLKPAITARLSPNCGVLVRVVYTQNVDFGSKSFDAIAIVGAGKEYRVVLDGYQAMPKIGAAVHSAFAKKEMFIWVTSDQLQNK